MKRKHGAIIAELADKLRSMGSWCGETHIQKSLFVGQELLGIPTDFDFILYKHGPFSFDLREALAEMRADGLLIPEPHPPYGPSLVTTPESHELRESFPNTLKSVRPHLDFIAEWLGDRGVFDLEQIATALYVLLPNMNMSDEKAATLLTEIKPHIANFQARSAIDELREKRGIWIQVRGEDGQ